MSEHLHVKSLSEKIQQARQSSYDQALSTLTQQESDFYTALKNVQTDFLKDFKQLITAALSELNSSQPTLTTAAEKVQKLELELATVLDTKLDQALLKLSKENSRHMQQVSIMSDVQKTVIWTFGIMLVVTLSALLAVVYRLQIWLPFLIVFAVILASIGITYALMLMQAQKAENN